MKPSNDMIPHSWIADERDCWRCASCDWLTYDDTKLDDNGLCEDCAKDVGERIEAANE
jgi:hypothetical protein